MGVRLSVSFPKKFMFFGGLGETMDIIKSCYLSMTKNPTQTFYIRKTMNLEFGWKYLPYIDTSLRKPYNILDGVTWMVDNLVALINFTRLTSIQLDLAPNDWM